MYMTSNGEKIQLKKDTKEEYTSSPKKIQWVWIILLVLGLIGIAFFLYSEYKKRNKL